MPERDIVVIGASAGGIEALKELVGTLRPDLPAAVLVVVHLQRSSQSVLPHILERLGRLPAKHGEHGEQIRPGNIYVAPPDLHMKVGGGSIDLSRGPLENGHRPAIDPLFRSAARVFGPRVIGVVLSGNLDDGSGGLVVIKKLEGVAVVQDPEDALFPAMPENAIDSAEVDYVVPIDEMASLLNSLAGSKVDKEVRTDMEGRDPDDELIQRQMAEQEDGLRSGQPSTFSCPDCGGVMWEFRDGDLIRYRCHVGHAFSVESLLAYQETVVEEALWAAVRALAESSSVSRRLASRMREQGIAGSAERFEEKARTAQERSDIVRDLILNAIVQPSNQPLP